MISDYCFCTLAVGKKYRKHGKLLAKDLQKQAPHVYLLILTDRPQDFQQYSNAIAIKHQIQTVKGYHDKRFVIEKALAKFETCIFVDSDVRIIDFVPEKLTWLPGITARTGCDILKHNSKAKFALELTAIKQVAAKLEINLESTKWFHEFMFVVKRQNGVEQTFLQLWQQIAYFFEMQGIYDGEGNVMGLAAAKAGFNVQFESQDRFLFFKDNIEKMRIKRGQSNLKDKQIYFDEHKSIEYPPRSLAQKVIDKLWAKIIFYYRVFRLKYFSPKSL